MVDANDLTARLLVAGHQAARLLENELGGMSLSAGEAMLLRVLNDEGLTMSGVMSALHIKASTATSLVARLEKAHWVQRVPNPHDRRSRIVALTSAGRRKRDAVEPAFAAVDAVLRRSAGDAAVRGHTRVLDVLARATGA